MNDVIWKRAIEIGEFIGQTHATVRETARSFGVSKSTVHKDVTDRLPKIRPHLAKLVREVLDMNKAERHIRGGEATRRKYQAEQAEQAL
ncbi:MAG: sporulation transcriptional regulator SpoIIID [Bacillota bacterium]|jgi:putative DeoR family transcriptional regulator (stage III sporulation protein D)